ncbi:MAG TPA: glycoside hydrolase domain-containing protein [Bryobacteraceae bacterium]|nr:glycoside hydrolase domain-containing protein [Bryobacteraceae bacterium]
MILIIDVASDPTPHLAQLKAAGVRTIFGYLSSINPHGEKCWTPQRVKTVAAAGFRIGLICEGWGGVDGKGISQFDGVRDGGYCRATASSLGAPHSACIYFAVDNDFDLPQIRTLVIPYFEGIAAYFDDNYYRVGVYGSGAVCEAVKSLGLVDLTWQAQSRGWMKYSEWHAKADLIQGPEQKLAGLDVDSDFANAPDIGDYEPNFGRS